ncbi:MAG: hypothetical protein ACK40G_11365 [Cytophagaceae bacterium]
MKKLIVVLGISSSVLLFSCGERRTAEEDMMGGQTDERVDDMGAAEHGGRSDTTATASPQTEDGTTLEDKINPPLRRRGGEPN